MHLGTGIGGRLAPFFAVVTLPPDVLVAIFLVLQAVAVEFIVGWLLLVPPTAVLFGLTNAEKRQEFEAWKQTADRFGDEDGQTATTADPVATLRDRYARGEIGEAEFERRLEALLETEDVDTEDQAAIELAVDGLGGVDGDDGKDRKTREIDEPAPVRE